MVEILDIYLRNLGFNEENRDRLKKLLKGVPSSWHGGGPDIFQEIDTASYVGSDVIVGHAGNFHLEGKNPDFAFAKRVLDYAKGKNVTMVMENSAGGGFLPDLKKAIEELDDLKICLDTGHIYVYDEPNASMKAYVDALKNRLHHLHLNDFLNHPVRDYTGGSYPEHFIPGTGIMPREDWLYLFRALEEVNFRGAAVLEIRPRVPLETARETVKFFKALGNGKER